MIRGQRAARSMKRAPGPVASFLSWEFTDLGDQVKVNESCPGSVETMKILTEAMEEARKDQLDSASHPVDLDEVRRAKEMLRKRAGFDY